MSFLSTPWWQALWTAAGAVSFGAAALTDLPLTPDQKAKLDALCPGGAALLVGAFPYYAGDTPGNLSLYCRGADYHTVLGERLEAMAQELRVRCPEAAFAVVGADNTPVPELAAAELAGVGWRGRHGLRIVPPYGSYVFLGSLVTDLPLPSTGPREGTVCPPGCRACMEACPTGALGEDGYRRDRCLSHWTQEKGDLPPAMAAAIGACGTLWGCDRCQTACPHNRKVPVTGIPAFRADLLPGLDEGDLAGLSNKAFRRRYGHRAFAWRGIGPLRRNLALLSRPSAQKEGGNPGEIWQDRTEKSHDFPGDLWYNGPESK